MIRRHTIGCLMAAALAWVGASSCKSDSESDIGAEGTTSGSSTSGVVDTGSETTTTSTSTTTDDTGGDEGMGSIACGPQLCAEGLLCVREITHDQDGQPVSEWFCRSKPDACGDEPGDCACAVAVCYNDPCACQDTAPNHFTCTNDGTCGGTTSGTDTGPDTDTDTDDTTGGSSSTGE